MFNYLRRKLGIEKLQSSIESMPILNKRYLELLTPIESVMAILYEPEADDTQIMFRLRSMGFFGGHEIRDAYMRGHKNTLGNIECPNCGACGLRAVWTPRTYRGGND